MTSDVKKLPAPFDLYDLWNYNDPAASRSKFEETAASEITERHRGFSLELQTQIARTYGLEANFKKAHEILDSVEKNLSDGDSLVRLRYYLERGRTYQSSGEVEKSHKLFSDAFAISEEMELDLYAVDAAHMLALADKELSKDIG